jgi:hypothetical protein
MILKDKILESARTLFAEKGFREVSVCKIAACAGDFNTVRYGFGQTFSGTRRERRWSLFS